MKKRVPWIDIAKCLGMFSIYLGHFVDAGGLAYPFVWTFHVPLFFFLSGCINNYDNEQNFIKFVRKKTNTILIPLFSFSLLSIALSVIIYNWGIDTFGFIEIKNAFIALAKGCIRNQFLAGQLWFLSCLFVMEIAFKLIKMLKNKYLILLVSTFIFIISETVILPRPISNPRWIYNIDSMMYYIIFYALGYCLYPQLIRLFELSNRNKKIIYVILFVITGVYTAILFEGCSLLFKMSTNSYIMFAFEVLQPLILIIFVLCVSKLLEGIPLLENIGAQSLYLCGNEYLVKLSFPMLLSVFGLSPVLDNPFKVYIYTFILILFNVKVLIPSEKRIVKAIKTNYRSMC